MQGRKALLEALRVLRDREEEAEWGWVLSGELRPHHQQAVDDAARQGLAELADRETRAELSVCEDRAVWWAARLTAHGQDVLAYADATPAPAPSPERPAEGEQPIELYRSEVEALRLYVHIAEKLRVPPVKGLAERVRTARQLGNRWLMHLTAERVESVAYALYLRPMGGSVTEANRFAREYGVAFHADRSTGSVQLTRVT
ncbi:DUF6417 family protein [Streptomyces sp. NPDC006739]|uniref:DUF6417 family protein n=1 Tax=Streptomyces sp. NPDC006739 TaxID=3364763 RepID=UPI00369E6369